MDDEQRARELYSKIVRIRLSELAGDPVAILTAAFAEVRSDTFQDALKPLKRRLKIDAEFSEPGHDRWRHHKSRAEALGEAIDDVRALSAEPAAPDPTKAHPQAKDINNLARRFEDAAVVEIASGDREPSARLNELGCKWIVEGLRLLADGRAALRLAEDGG